MHTRAINRILLSQASIFLSHSHSDLLRVRDVRDQIEMFGGDPLIFRLNCLNNDPSLFTLLQREIDARNFFLICDSPDARASHWVQKEIAYVRSARAGTIIASLDIDWPWSRQVEAIEDLARRTTVSMSYARRDIGRVRAVLDILIRHGFTVIDPGMAAAGEVLQLPRAQPDFGIAGHVVVFLSPAALHSDWFRREAEEILLLDDTIVSLEYKRRIVVIELEPLGPATFENPYREFQALKTDAPGFERALLARLGLERPAEL